MRVALLTALVATAAVGASAQTDIDQDAITQALLTYSTGTTAYAKPRVEDIDIDDKSRTVTIKFNESAAYIPMTAEQVAAFTSQVRALLPDEYAKYKIVLCSGDYSFDTLAITPGARAVKPKAVTPIVTHTDAAAAPDGLDGANIALWQSHGRFFDQGANAWSWQRPRLYQTCEDLFTQSFVMPFLMPMLENAGAYVMSPRERDVHTAEYIIDNDNAAAMYNETSGTNAWADAPRAGFAHNGGDILDGHNPFEQGTARMAKAVKTGKGTPSTITWDADIAEPGSYAVYVSYQSEPNSATDARYTINAADGPHEVRVNQQMGSGTWIYLGHYMLDAGRHDQPIVSLSNESSNPRAVVTADAVKIGGGMGNVARTPSKPQEGVDYRPMTSGYPRFTEGSRYWLQWAGAPDSVYSATHGETDYNDDYRSRGLWVNWLAGGSSVLPKERGLGIPVDLSFAFHSDAGITRGDSIVGTLGIYCTDDTDYYPGGSSRWAARDLTNLVMTNIVDDVRASFEPRWTRRGMWNRSYAEARVPQVPAMLLELLSHQNFADMRYGLDPAFRFVVSRGIYKGMLKYIAGRDGRPYVVQPLPVQTFAISGGADGRYTLSWAERPDTLEATATPKYYIVEERVGDAIAFRRIARVEEPRYEVTVNDNEIHSYRIIAGNSGGTSFASEVLALRYAPDAPQVMIVNGFTRVSAPDSFDWGEAAGFVDERDPGVPYVQDISFTGVQFEHRRDIPWMANETAGLGASRSDYEDRVIAGNTFDFVAVHGASIAAAGYGFISASVDAFTANGTDAPIVDLIMGAQKESQPGSGRYGTRYKTFSAPLQARLIDYTGAGGNVIVSGSYIATDLWNNPYSSTEVAEADRKFAKDVLGYTWRAGNATKIGRVCGVSSPYSMFDRVDFTFHNDRNGICYGAVAPDAIAAGNDGATTILKYVHTDLTAGTAYVASTHRAVAIGVPFETIESRGERDALMADILRFFK